MRKIGLLPFTILYWLITSTRNVLFDIGVLRTLSIPGKSISVGNLSLGGSGKTPMIIYLTHLLSQEKSVQILSRGYGRKTKGFRHVSEVDTPSTVGDEPFDYYQKFKPEVDIFVCEKRKAAIPRMKSQNGSAVILLDDAFQHRYVKPGFQLLLTPFHEQFLDDHHLPSGNLRESKRGASRADAILLTKCPMLTEEQRLHCLKRYQEYQKPVFFSQIEYLEFQSKGKQNAQMKAVFLVSGISSTTSLNAYLCEKYEVQEQKFADHHAFNKQDIQEIHRKFDTFAHKEMAIVTTEKDWVKLQSLLSESDLQAYPWYVLPITVKIQEEQAFNSMILNYVRNN